MGIYDRDYTRSSSSSSPPSTHASRAIGKLRFLSVNTWIIIINVVVFLLGAHIYGHSLLGDITYRMDAGRFANSASVTTEQIQHAVVDRAHHYGFPNQPGYEGERLLDAKTGQQIGWQRVVEKPILNAFGDFSTGKAFFEVQVWRFITFQFLHFNFQHLFFNMLGLWFAGSLVEQYLGGKRYAAFYLISGVFGGVSYLILNFLGFLVHTAAPALQDKVPGLLFHDVYTPLIGASAGVFGVLMAAAFIAPNAIVEFMFILPMRLKVFVYGYVAFVVFNLLVGGQNAGGDAAHLGGVIAGYYFIRHTHLLRDFFEVFGKRSHDPPSRKKRPAIGPAGPRDGFASEVDRILEKVKQDGLQSLTNDERQILARASRSR